MKKDLSSMSSDTGATLLPRRQFLVLGSAAVAVAATSSLSADLLRGALVTEDQTPRFSVGFLGATIADFGSPSFAPRLTSAASLRSGDASLANGVRLKIHGLVRPEAVASKDVSVSLDAMYRVAGSAEEVPFLAWSYARMRQHTSYSSAKEFVVPVDAKKPLSLGITSSAVTSAVDGARVRGTVALSLGDRRRTEKLRAGLYFVAICPAGMETPHWASIYATMPETGTAPILKQATLTGLTPVPFDYLVVATGRA